MIDGMSKADIEIDRKVVLRALAHLLILLPFFILLLINF
jgi:hypothetical protein